MEDARLQIVTKGGEDPVGSIDQGVTECFQKASSFTKMKQPSVFEYRDFLLLRTVIFQAIKHWPDPRTSKINMRL